MSRFGGGGDIMQRVAVVLESQGADSLTIVRDGIRAVKDAIEGLNLKYANDSDSRQYITSLNKLASELGRLEKMEVQLTQTMSKEIRDRIDALARQERAEMALADATQEAAGRAMRARIDAYARQERAAEQAAARQKALVDQQISDEARLQAYLGGKERDQRDGGARDQAELAHIDNLKEEARLQDWLKAKAEETGLAEAKAAQLGAEARRQGTQAVAEFVAKTEEEAAQIQRAKVATIEAMGERARFYAAVEQRAEESGKKQVAAQFAADEAIKLQIGDLKRARIDAYVEAEDAAHKQATAGQAVTGSYVQTTAATREQIQALKDMGIIQDQVTTKVASGKGQFGGFATAAEQAADKTKKFGYAAMNASYLVQDMQYGIGAVANNIGLMTQSLSGAFPKLDTFITKIGVPGGATGLGAGIMLAAVGFDLLYHNWDTVKGAFGQGVPAKLLGDLDSLKASLKELEEKKIKTSIDYMDIRIAQAETAKLTELEATYQRLKSGKTKAQQRQSEVVSEAIIEGGGTGDYTTGVDNIAAAVKQIRGKTKSATTLQLEEEYASQKRMEEGAANAGLETSGIVAKLSELEKQIEIQKAADEENRSKQARDIVSGAAQGNTQSLAELARLFKANPQAFIDRGVDDSRFAAGLEMAQPENLFEPERREKRREDKKKQEAYVAKVIADNEAADAKIKAAQDKLKSEADQKVNRIVAAVGPGFDEGLQSSIYGGMKSGQTPQEAAETQRAGVADVLKKRMVPEDAIAKVADILLSKAIDATQNLIMEGKLPAIDKAIAKGVARQGRADARDEAAHAREMKQTATAMTRIGDQGAENFFASQFQAMTGANQLQSRKAGKGVYAKAKGGMDPMVAMGEEYRELLDELRNLGQITLQQQAMMLQNAGVLGQSVQVVRQLNAQMRQGMGLQKRLGTGRPSNLSTLPSF